MNKTAKGMCNNQSLGSKPWVNPRPMTQQEFKKFGEFIQSEFGIKMPPGKKTMLESRLNKRLRTLNMGSYQEYKDYLFSLKGLEVEMPHLVDAVTTNKTEFFREGEHFELLYNQLLPGWLAEKGDQARLMAWSAGCSNGKEPYTLAIVLNEFAEQNPGLDYQILGTDISRQVLQEAARAVYPEDAVQSIPYQLRKKYLLRSKDRQKKLVRIKPELRSKVSFRELNLMQEISFREHMDIIFCRNVIIYFERPVQETLFGKLCSCLEQGGYLFIGHSETLSGMDLPLKQVRPTVYQRI